MYIYIYIIHFFLGGVCLFGLGLPDVLSGHLFGPFKRPTKISIPKLARTLTISTVANTALSSQIIAFAQNFPT